MKELFGYQRLCIDMAMGNYRKYYHMPYKGGVLGEYVQSLFFGMFMGTGTGKTFTALSLFKELRTEGYFDKLVLISEKVILSDASGFESDAKELGFSVENYTRGKSTSFKEMASAEFLSDVILINKDKFRLSVNAKGYIDKLASSCDTKKILFILDEGVYYKEKKNQIVGVLRSKFEKSHKILSTATPLPNRTESLVGLLENLGVLKFLFPEDREENTMRIFDKLVDSTIDWFRRYHTSSTSTGMYKELERDSFYFGVGSKVNQQLMNYNVYNPGAKVFNAGGTGVIAKVYRESRNEKIGARKILSRSGNKVVFSDVSYVDRLPKDFLRDEREGFKIQENPVSELAKRCSSFWFVYCPVNRPLETEDIEVMTGVSKKRVEGYYMSKSAESKNLKVHYLKRVGVGFGRDGVENVFPQIGEARNEAIYDIVRDGSKTLIYTWTADYKDSLSDYLNSRGIKAFTYYENKKDAKWKDILENEAQVMIVGYQEASKGINVHKFCTRVICGQMTDNYENYIQAVGRVWARVGQEGIGKIVRLFVEGTTDRSQYEGLNEKHKVAMKFDYAFNIARFIN